MDLTGKLIVAMPAMGDPRFERAVILVCAHSADGAMGLIVNKPLPDLSFSNLLTTLKIPPQLLSAERKNAWKEHAEPLTDGWPDSPSES